MDDELKWSAEGAEYLQRARRTSHSAFLTGMESFKGNHYRGQDWFHEGKSCMIALYHYSEEFAPDASVPGACFSSPEHFSRRLDEYEAFVRSMRDSMRRVVEPFVKHQEQSVPQEASDLLELIDRILTAIRFVRSRTPSRLNSASEDASIIVERAARQFHESALALRKHPHGGTVYQILDEWDCQYIFKVILSAIIRDIRIEEWSPSVAGSSARCEFYLKSHRLMVELKYARRASDTKVFKTALLTDFRDYGAHPGVDTVIVLIYDPQHVLENAVQVQTDLSVPTNGLSEVKVVVSPPRSTHGA